MDVRPLDGTSTIRGSGASSVAFPLAQAHEITSGATLFRQGRTVNATGRIERCMRSPFTSNVI
jgi:hypothetical protein